MKRLAEAKIPTPWGKMHMTSYGPTMETPNPHLALKHVDLKDTENVLVRVHSECITGDIFQSLKCDCGEQLHKSLELISKSGGILIYLRQEGRGIGISNKLHAYQLQDEGFDTAEANVKLGFKVDERDFADAITILKDMGISSIRLLTNNPEKVKAFNDSGITVTKRVPLVMKPNKDNLAYLKTKKDIMGHFLSQDPD